MAPETAALVLSVTVTVIVSVLVKTELSWETIKFLGTFVQIFTAGSPSVFIR